MTPNWWDMPGARLAKHSFHPDASYRLTAYRKPARAAQMNVAPVVALPARLANSHVALVERMEQCTQGRSAYHMRHFAAQLRSHQPCRGAPRRERGSVPFPAAQAFVPPQGRNLDSRAARDIRNAAGGVLRVRGTADLSAGVPRPKHQSDQTLPESAHLPRRPAREGA